MSLQRPVLKTIFVALVVLGVTLLHGTWAWSQQEDTRRNDTSQQEDSLKGDSRKATQQRKLKQKEDRRSFIQQQAPQERQDTQQNAAAEQYADDQPITGCEGPQEVDTFGPDTESQITPPFDITGNTFRLTYETTNLDQRGFPFLDVTILDDEEVPVGGRIIFDEGTETENVLAGPGTFTLEIRAEDLTYTITVEDCTGEEETTTEPPGEEETTTEPTGDDQDDVIDDTIPDKPLPNTGGAPLILIASMILAGGGLLFLRASLRRDS